MGHLPSTRNERLSSEETDLPVCKVKVCLLVSFTLYFNNMDARRERNNCVALEIAIALALHLALLCTWREIRP